MLNLAHNTRIFLHVPATDLRKSFDGLGGLVRSAFGADPCDGSWFLFFNRRRDRVKVADAANEVVVPEHTRRKHPPLKPRREQLPAHLPRYEVELPVADDVKSCVTHGEKKLIGHDRLETLEFERPKLKVRVTLIPKFACEKSPECGVTEAARPEGLVEGNRYDTSVAAEIIADKFGYHLPIYRQQDLFAGSGWAPSRSTLLASQMLSLYQQLYDVEDRARGLPPAERQALRESDSQPLWKRLRELLDGDLAKRVLPKEKIAEALGYLRHHWDALRLYLTDGRVPIDNNDVEQLMKQVAIGRKNWLFIGSVSAGERAANFLTLVSSALRNDLDVYAYLKAVLDALLSGSTDYAALRPDQWATAHPEAIRQYRREERRDRYARKTARRTERRTLANQSPENDLG